MSRKTVSLIKDRIMNRFWLRESAVHRSGLLLLMLLGFLLTPAIAQADYSVTTSIGAHGTISPASALVSSGATTTFTLTPDPGYHVWAASGCQGGISGTTYMTGAITGDCTVAAIFAPNASPSSATDTWMPTGPETGIIRTLVIDPKTPTTLYVGTRGGGIFKSQDSGATWTATNNGLPTLNVRSLAIDPVTPSTLYAGVLSNGLYKSTDSGQSWASVGNLSDTYGYYIIYSIAIDPVTPLTLYVSTDRASVLKSTNGGVNWTTANSGLSYPVFIAIDPLNTSTLYAASALGVFKTTNGGTTWNATPSAPSATINTLAIDPVTPSNIYVGTSQNGVYKSTDSGANWTAANTGLTTPGGILDLRIDPVTPSNLYAATARGSVFRSMNGGVNWSSVFPGLAATPVLAIAMNPNDRNTVYAGTYAGVFKSVDGGTTCDFANKGLIGYNFDSIAVDPVEPSIIYMGTSGCFLRSFDNGTNWQIMNCAFAGRQDYIYSLAIDPVDPSIIYAGAFSYPSARYTQGGAFYSDIYVNRTIFAIDPITNTTVYAGGYGMNKSIDSGSTWSAINTGLTNSWISALVIDPSVPATLYAATGTGVFKTSNSGSTWSAINSGLTTTYINTLAVNPVASSNIYAGTESGVFVSSDSGNLWSAINSGLTNTHVTFLAVDPVNTSYVYAGTQGGVFKSGDAGSTWNTLNSALPSGPISAFAHAAASPPALYAAVQGAGLFKYIDNITYTVTTNAGAGGSISPSSAIVNQGSVTTFTLAPTAGYQIEAVSGCGGTLVGNIYTTGAITSSCTVSATFVPIARTLSVIVIGSGTVHTSPGTDIACTSNCGTSYDDGTVVTLTASPGTESTFAVWLCDCMGTTNPWTNPCSTTMDKDKTCRALFQLASSATTTTTRYLVWEDDTYGNNEIFVKKSTDGGATWLGPYRVTYNTTNSQNPSLATYGNAVYIAWQDDVYGNNEILVKKSTDNGLTWQGPYRVTNNSGNSQNPSLITIGGTLYVAWQDDTHGNNEIFVKKSTDGGVTWQELYQVTYNTGNSQNPSLVASGNVLYLAWQDDTYGNNEIFVKTLEYGGLAWSWPYRITYNSGNSQNPVLLTYGGTVYVAWQDDTYGNNEIFVKKTTDGGVTWQGPYQVTYNTGNSQNPSLVASGGVLYLAWQDDVYGNNEIFVKKSTDGGVTWQGPYRVTSNNGNSQNPSLTATGGVLYLTWQDDTYGNNEIFVKKSTDGAVWQGPYRVTNNTGASLRPKMK